MQNPDDRKVQKKRSEVYDTNRAGSENGWLRVTAGTSALQRYAQLALTQRRSTDLGI